MAVKDKKQCKICKEVKPRSEFYTNGKRRPGATLTPIRPECKTCNIQVNLAKDRADKSRARRRGLKYEYGMTVAEYDLLLQQQGGVCAICRRAPDDSKKRFAVDHCHKSGKIRGILCTRCNQGIGYFKDNPLLLRLAATYLEKLDQCQD